MKTLLTVSATLIATTLPGALSAQQPDRPREVQGLGRGFGVQSSLMRALDSDGDGEISAEEIKNAGKSLAKLDKDENGKLTMDELRVVRVRPNPDTLVASMLERNDKNEDGKLSGDEITDRMKGLAERADADNDGVLTKEELKKYYSAPPIGQFADRFFGQYDKDGDGKVSGDEITDRMKSLVERADADNDGALTREEFEGAFRFSSGGRGPSAGTPSSDTGRPSQENQRRDRPDGT